MSPNNPSVPLVSVIIPSFNHAKYLVQAVESALSQDYRALEVIVINDGSTDNTDEVVKRLHPVIYIKQENAGLSAARNVGISASSGAYLLFLDADDVLLPGAIAIQVKHLEGNKQAVFVSGGHIKADETLNTTEEVSIEIEESHYLHLLQGNYIGMHAAVLYRSSVFKEFSFDTSLKAAEDYDLYLKITAKYPVVNHTQFIAIYRQSHNSMSSNLSLMLESVLLVLERQVDNLSSADEKEAYTKGKKIWAEYYCCKIFKLLLNKKVSKLLTNTKEYKATLWKYNRRLYIRVFLHQLLF